MNTTNILQRLLVGTALLVFAGTLWVVFAVVAVILFDAAYWCVTTCWHHSSVRGTIAMVVPAVLSLFITYAVFVCLRRRGEKQKRKRSQA